MQIAPSNVRSNRHRGMTVIELLIALAVVGFLMSIGYMGLRKVRKSSLREESVKVAATLRNAFNMATQTGKHHRVVFDLEQQSYRIEICEGDGRLRRNEKAIDPDEKDEPPVPTPGIDSLMPQEMLHAGSPEQAAEIAGALAGTRVGRSRCGKPTLPTGSADGRGSERKVRTDEGLAIRRIFVQHMEEPQLDGTVTINFFPLGYAEKAVVELVDDDGEQYSLLVHGLTGRVEFAVGELDDPNDHMLRDGAGDVVKER